MRPRPPLALAIFGAVLLLPWIIACGIRYTGADDSSELLQELTISGELRPRGTLELELQYEQPYPVDIDIQCDLIAVELTGTPTPTPTDTPTPPAGATATPVQIPRPRPTTVNKVQDILFGTVPANPAGGPVDEATPEPGTIRQSFPAPDLPGTYLVACFTPSDDENRISKELVIAHPTPDGG